jgi:hypothetical protein
MIHLAANSGYDVFVMTITLSDRTVRRLSAEASRRGVRADQLAEQLLDAALSEPAATEKPNQSSIEILNEWEAQTASTDPQDLAQAQREFEEFKQAMNETRRATDGPNARVPFP